MFEEESKGLEQLSAHRGPRVPEVIGTGIAVNNSYMVMDWLEPGKRKVDYFENFGRALAELHSNSQNSFGLDHDNYIGSLPQSNRKHVSGSEFFIEERLLPQAEAAFASGVLPSAAAKEFESLLQKIPSILPNDKPALIHGDLWSGNVVTGTDGNAWLIDPAVYYGYRESDIAMTMLFGGFDQSFYNAYHEAFPLTGDWRSRVDLFNLYPLLVHVNLFGGSYVSQAMQILNKYR
jgi:fructosamine-3-kinase